MPNLLEELNDSQKQAVTHKEGPLLIVAGAGTGKTTVITRRVAYLIEQKLAVPEQIAALTFTEKAAGEMEERLDQLLELGQGGNIWVNTFHGFCERILKTHGLDIGLPNNFELLEDTRQWIFVYKNFEKFNLDYYRPLGNPSHFISALLRHFSRCKDEMISPKDYLDYAESLRLAQDQPVLVRKKRAKKADSGTTVAEAEAEIPAAMTTEIKRLEEVAGAYHLYQKLLLDNNYLDFGDLINYCLELFKKRPKLLQYYQNKFKYILVDEFQDTNLAQYELIKLLTQQKGSLTVVGDDDQSIYKFRGASVSNILKLKEDYPNLSEITLTDNYRNDQSILDLAYTFIQNNNPDRLEGKLKISKKLHSHQTAGGVIEVLEGLDITQEFDLVCKKILELKKGQQSSWNDFAILLRRNATADALLPVLSLHNIPFTFVANTGLYKKPIIADLLGYLRLLNNFHDSNSLYRVLALPKFKLEPEELSALLSFAHKKTISLWESLQQAGGFSQISDHSKKIIAVLLDLLRKHADQVRHLSAAEIAVHIIKDLGFEERVQEDTLENSENRELLEQFYKKIENFCRQEPDKGLHNFLATLDLELQAGNDGDIKFDPSLGPESLKVLTIHSAKGLEFKNVFIVSLVDQQFPSRERGETIEIPETLIKDILPEGDFHLQEERRLFYVGITRAKTNLYLSWAKDYGGKRLKKPSLFLLETQLIPAEKANLATGKVVFNKPLKEKVVYQVTPTEFSYSELIDFQTCPLKYKYRYYLKLPVPGSPYLSFGQTLHKVFEEYLNLYKRNLELPQQDLFGEKPKATLPDYKYLEELYLKYWIDDWYNDKRQKQEFREKGQKMLKTFFDSLTQNGCQPKYIEKKFLLALGQYKFKGKIDRADNTAEGLEIWDYKTGKAPKKGEKKDLDQLRIYQWAVQDFLHEPVAGLKYWYLDENLVRPETTATEAELQALQAELLELVEKVINTTRFDLFKEEHTKVRDHRCEFEHLE